MQNNHLNIGPQNCRIMKGFCVSNFLPRRPYVCGKYMELGPRNVIIGLIRFDTDDNCCPEDASRPVLVSRPKRLSDIRWLVC